MDKYLRDRTIENVLWLMDLLRDDFNVETDIKITSESFEFSDDKEYAIFNRDNIEDFYPEEWLEYEDEYNG